MWESEGAGATRSSSLSPSRLFTVWPVMAAARQPTSLGTLSTSRPACRPESLLRRCRGRCNEAHQATFRHQGRIGLDSPPNFLVGPKGRFKIQDLFNGTPILSLWDNIIIINKENLLLLFISNLMFLSYYANISRFHFVFKIGKHFPKYFSNARFLSKIMKFPFPLDDTVEKFLLSNFLWSHTPLFGHILLHIHCKM